MEKVEKEGGLKDRQRRFVQLVAGGMAAGRAYEQAGYKASGDTADAAASRLLGNVKVMAYLEELREEIRQNTVIDQHEVELFLSKIIRTPIGRVDENSPLCQEWVRVDKGGSDDEDAQGELFAPGEGGSATVRVKMVGKIEAIKQLSAMKGWNKPVQVDHKVSISDIMDEINDKPGPGA